MPSLRSAYTFLGLGPGTGVPGDLGTHPRSVREFIEACRDPRLGDWSNPSRGRVENKDFSEEAQGIGTDGQHWFLSNNANDGREALWKLNWDFKVKAKRNSPFPPDATHIGALSVRDGSVLVALQGPHGAWKVSTDFQQSTVLKAEELPDKDMFAWCDRNPHNGLIYTSAFDFPSHVRAYAESGSTLIRRPEHDIPLIQPKDARPTTSVQGACFTPRHKWLALCDDAGGTGGEFAGPHPKPGKKKPRIGKHWVERIHCHSTLNGAFLGSRDLEADTDESGSALPTTTHNELEDIEVFPMTSTTGAAIHVHVLELNNEELSPDDFYLWHFAVPEPEAL